MAKTKTDKTHAGSGVDQPVKPGPLDRLVEGMKALGKAKPVPKPSP